MYDITIDLLPENGSKLIERKPTISFYEALKNSYKDTPDSNAFIKNGYFMDNDLSTRNTQVYVRPSRKKLLVTTAGTRAFEGHDVITDVKSLFGIPSARYKETESILEKAKKKYGIKRAHLVGHSLGYMINNKVASKEDEVIGYNGAWGIPTFHKSKSKRVTHIRDENDVMSWFTKSSKVIKSTDPFRLGNKGGHLLTNLKNNSYGNTDVFRIHNELSEG